MPVIQCNKAKCKEEQGSFLDECIDCTLGEQIERDLLKEQVGKKE